MTFETASPFADIRQLAAAPPAPGPSPTLEQGGRLAEISAWLSAWSGKTPPAVNRPVVALYAGARQGVGPRGWARERLEAIASGGATVSRLAGAQGAGLEAFDLAIDRPSPDFVEKPSMSEKEAAATMAFGMEALAKQPDLLIPGVIAAEPARAAGAICLALFGGEASDWSDQPEPVAAAIVRAVDPAAIEHCMAAHVGPAKGHARLLEILDKRPLLALDTADEEGVGGASALALVKLACEVR